MHLKFSDRLKKEKSFSLYLKSGAIFLLFVLSVLIVSCGSNATNTDLGNPPVTVTINLNGDNGSPTPPVPDYSCNAWTTNATPGYNLTGTIGVYAKYTHIVDGNPQGVPGSFAVATVLWPDGNPYTTNATTTPDGLAVFSVPISNRAADVGKVTLVTVNFGAAGNAPACIVQGTQSAFFTLVIGTPGTSPTAGGPGGSPTACPPRHKPHC